MNLHFHPDKQSFDTAKANDDPVLVLVAFDGAELLAGSADESMEHIILLRQLGRRDTEIDKYFRVVVNSHGADWTFVCPSDYRGIKDRARRIQAFFGGGIELITRGLLHLGYTVPIEIPQRYRRHWNELPN